MELTGSYELQGSERDIWDMLHSPEVLKNIVPGCTSIDTIEGGRLKALVTTRIGPMKVNFEGSMSFDDIEPHSYFRLAGQGEGGPAGFVKGTADIRLTPSGNGLTTLTYTAHSDIGGKLASLGGRLLEAISRKNVDSFFQDLQSQLSGDQPAQAAPPTTRHNRPTRPANNGTSILPLLNTLLLAAAVAALWVIALQ